MKYWDALTEVQKGSLARRESWKNRKFVIKMRNGTVVLSDGIESFTNPFVATSEDLFSDDWVIIKPDHFEFLDYPQMPRIPQNAHKISNSITLN